MARGRNERVGALDGLRGLAVAAVLLYHSQFSFARGGFLGVSAFFTLSGFLITSLLLSRFRDGQSTGLRTFWGRRARRLLPAALLALLGVLLFAATVATPDQLRLLRGDMIASLGYVANWRFHASGQSYANLFSAPSPMLHFWSLAIEEQFYLVFPLVVALVAWATRRGTELRRRQVLGAVLVTGIAASIVASGVLYTHHGSSRAYYGTDTRAAELLIGALLAVVLAGRVHSEREPSQRTRLLATGAGVSALGLMAWWWTSVNQSSPWLYRGGFAMHACCAAIVVAAARVTGPFARTLAWRPLAALGLISYGVYLFHWPIFLWLTPERTGLAAVPLLGLRLALTIGLAIASFELVEQPILRGERTRLLPRRLRVPGPVAIPLGVGAIAAALLLVTTSVPAPTVVFAPVSVRSSALQTRNAETRAAHAPTSVPAPQASPLYRKTSTARPVRVLVVGDSVAQTLGRGLELWALDTGRATVQNRAKEFCSLGRVLPRRLPLGNVLAPSAGCSEWAHTWPRTISSFDPDVVVVQYTVWEAEARELPDGEFASPGDPALDRWQLSEYQAAADILSARGAPVLWLGIPCDDEPIKRDDPFWVIDNKTIPALAASRSAVHQVDMNRLMCPGGTANPVFEGVDNVRPDGAHYTDAGALAVARWLMPIVLGEQPAPPRIFPNR